jgi:Protein of unknown function (DUF2865)
MCLMLAVAAACCSITAPAEAQGLLDLFFGGPKPQPVIIPLSRTAKPAGGNAGAIQSEPKHSNADASGERSGGTYRTVCVRMCDGFFVPMSYATTKGNFQQDQNKCRASCGDDARLFFHRNPGGAMEEAVDLNGRVYGRLPNAFKFRKTLVDGCSCRPPPWSEAELARHRAYATGPQSPVPGQPLPQVTKQSTKVADAAPTSPNEPAPAKFADDAKLEAAPVPKPVKTKTTGKSRDAATETPRVIKIAAQPPVMAPPIVKGSASQPPGGLFGFGSQSGMGLTGKPKYVWPGD